MNISVIETPVGTPIVRPNLLAELPACVAAAQALLERAVEVQKDKFVVDGRADSTRLEAGQRATHALAWYSTYVEALREMASYAERLNGEGRFGETEALVVQIGFSEYLWQLYGGIPMSQGEMVRPQDLGLSQEDQQVLMVPEVMALTQEGNGPDQRARLMELIRAQDGAATVGDAGLDETLDAMRAEMTRFCAAEVLPHAHEWHLANDYIPLEVIAKMAELGVFGLTIPEEFGGLGMGKEAMCLVSEELSRGYIGIGSLGTRSEIAAELILCGGTQAQKEKWLPAIAAGDILPTAVFTEPNTGSDLASLKTRAVRDGDTYKVTGNKTWITHPVRADLMTMLVRTNPDQPGYKGLSILLGEKPRGTDEEPFPAAGMTGGEIEVLGYRGMKEYEIAFDDFEVPAENLLGGTEGQGFKQLMQTFEPARIQTGARAVGVAQSAFDLALRYAEDRSQFGKPIVNFPRIADKLVMMAVETQFARQMTYFAARQKDNDVRCDVEAGMAKLLAARVAWAAADNALQIHGGNGFALEYPVSRVLCDARILNIFEGAAEIQAQVIARRILEA
ncbi:MAG: acyl-CoA dehydrogenase family protein [Pseudomonadota bacterium]